MEQLPDPPVTAYVVAFVSRAFEQARNKDARCSLGRRRGVYIRWTGSLDWNTGLDYSVVPPNARSRE